mgnify:FL=1
MLLAFVFGVVVQAVGFAGLPDFHIKGFGAGRRTIDDFERRGVGAEDASDDFADRLQQLGLFAQDDRVEGDYTVKAKVELNSAKLYTDTGYMWIEYTKDLYTEDGTFWMTTEPVKSRITVINKDGEWTAVNIQSEQ